MKITKLVGAKSEKCKTTDASVKPGLHASISIRTKQKVKQRNEVKLVT